MAVHWPLTFARCLLADKSHVSSAGCSSVLFEMWIPYSTPDPEAADGGNVSGRTPLTGEKDNGAVSRLLSPMEAICQQWLRLTVSSTIGGGPVTVTTPILQRCENNRRLPWSTERIYGRSPPVEKKERITRCIKVIKPPPLTPPPPFPCPSPLFILLFATGLVSPSPPAQPSRITE